MASASTNDTSGRLWIEQGEDATGPVATVALVGPIERTYSYRLTEDQAASLTPGQRVNVPVGKRGRLVPGFCISVDQGRWDHTLRGVDSFVDDESFLTGDLLELGAWISKHYACPLGRTLGALVPEDVRKKRGFVVRRYVRLDQPIEQIEAGGPRIGPKQRAVLERLRGLDGGIEINRLAEETGASRATIRALERKHWIRLHTERQPSPAPNFDVAPTEPEYELNADQEAALAEVRAMLDERAFRVMLLFGVSGSGKTEVYIHAMREVLRSGRQVVLLVPEIALTTQLVRRLASRFERVAVVHSGLSGVQRSLTWQAIRSGEKQVVIGTRSAVFAPCPDLGLIVVDEEQETSYKNLQAPRFHVRDVAVVRGRQLSIPVLLGSATPSLESWHNCTQKPHYQRVDLPRRVRDLPLPEVTVIDMNDEYQEKTGIPLLSHVLVRRLGETLARKEQAVLLLNRRGYASWLVCSACKHRLTCPNCDINMVFHAATAEVVCHHCHRRTPAPQHCPNPSCGGRLSRMGSGTQRVEQRLAQLFPEARIARVDSDTMRRETTYRRLIADFEARTIDCLIGTQMIAKGLDFPFVSFVGVVGADAASYASDFRAGERLFQLVTQVAGRAGRADVPGQVVVQTQSPDEPALQAALRHDYLAFVDDELNARRMSRMPPFARLARVVVSDPDERRARDAATGLADEARRAIAELQPASADVLGPTPCVLARLRSRYRFEVLLRSQTAGALQSLLDRLRGDRRLSVKAAGIVVDVDPVSLI